MAHKYIIIAGNKRRLSALMRNTDIALHIVQCTVYNTLLLLVFFSNLVDSNEKKSAQQKIIAVLLSLFPSLNALALTQHKGWGKTSSRRRYMIIGTNIFGLLVSVYLVCWVAVRAMTQDTLKCGIYADFELVYFILFSQANSVHWEIIECETPCIAYIPASHAQSQTRLLLIITVIVCSHNITNQMKLVFGTPHCRGLVLFFLFLSFLFISFFFALQYTLKIQKQMYYQNACYFNVETGYLRYKTEIRLS